MSILWIQVSHTYPEADQMAVSWVSYLMSQNNFLFFEHGKYMQIYPNQLGLSAILEALYRLTGGENWKAFIDVYKRQDNGWLGIFLPYIQAEIPGSFSKILNADISYTLQKSQKLKREKKATYMRPMRIISFFPLIFWQLIPCLLYTSRCV